MFSNHAHFMPTFQTQNYRIRVAVAKQNPPEEDINFFARI
jgi:hypothetical protein